MLEEMVKDYSAYFKLDVSTEFQTVQDVIDNMLTRLEELTSVLQMIKLKNSECNTTVSDDINKYRNEITTLSKKIDTVNEVLVKLNTNINVLEKQMEKAETDFGVLSDNKIKSLLKPFLKRNTAVPVSNLTLTPPNTFHCDTVLDHFENLV